MKKGFVILAALSIALLMGSSALLAQEKAPVEKEKGTCKKEMKLTYEQKAKIEEMRTNLRLKMIDLKAEREKLAIALKQEMKKPEPSMQEIEGIVKKLSGVREKIQLATIEHRLAMKKFLGPDACKGGFMGMGEGCGEKDHGEGHECRMMRQPRMGMREGREMPHRRTMVIKTDGSGCEMGHGGTVMWQQRASGAGCAEHAGMADCVVMMKKAHKCNHPRYGNWYHKMYRPFGRGDAHQTGCCSIGQGGHAEGCMKKCTGKEIKCTVEVKEEPKK
jgi:hypothetical protein